MHDLSRRSFLAAAGGLSLASLIPAALAQGKIKPGPDSALVVVDVQNCFLPGGSLAVKAGDEIIPVINRIAKSFQNVVLTQDWHTPGHVSFASSHEGKKPFESIKLPYGNQILWPDHCVQGTEGAAFHPALEVTKAQLILRKGHHAGIDSYSAFRENDRMTRTGLDGYLKARGFTKLVFCGLALDYCVAWSAIDARQSGFNVAVVVEATAAIDLDGSRRRMLTDMRQAGINLNGTA
jgi:nicotinamidase/pyrazinamidase